jgi:hypothetical protein
MEGKCLRDLDLEEIEFVNGGGHAGTPTPPPPPPPNPWRVVVAFGIGLVNRFMRGVIAPRTFRLS